MSLKVKLPGIWRGLAGGPAEVPVEGGIAQRAPSACRLKAPSVFRFARRRGPS